MSSFSSSHIVLYSLLHLIRKHFAQIFNFGTFAVVMTIFLNSHVSQPTPSTSLMVPSGFFYNYYYLFIFVVWKISHHCASYIFVPAMILLDVLSELDMECMSEFSPVRDTDVEDNKGVLFVFCYISWAVSVHLGCPFHDVQSVKQSAESDINYAVVIHKSKYLMTF